MPTDTLHVAGPFFEAEVEGLLNGDDWDVDPADTDLGAVEVRNIVHGGDCDVKLLVDPDNDGTYEIDVTLDSLTGTGVSQGNEIEASDDDNMVIRITNTSGGAADYVVTGREVSQ